MTVQCVERKVAISARSVKEETDSVSKSESVLQDEQQQQVFDLSLIQQQQNQSQDKLSTEEKSNGISSQHLPPLESLTTDDDNTSVSSVSTQGSIQRRSMFSQYWKKTGQEPPRYYNVSRSSSCGTAISSTSLPSNGCALAGFLATPPEHEAVLDVQVPSMTAAAAASDNETNSHAKLPSRRNMFHRSHAFIIRPSSSAPSLSSYHQDQDSTATTSLLSSGSPRKTRSHSHLLSKQPSFSCLRESRFSPRKNCEVRRNSSATTASTLTDSASIVSGSSVRFDLTATSVMHYDLPQERYAEDGWSSYFE
ncbi:hypothetical protein IV203_007478 [Nitzschia inconspicua]|uniref:Uncharacterized protein n=1 Tax=Nitzschia inconspicua TaxID=303405 RepID=A0A9K3PD01_9STRA|nr:hypothetical protein IV203_007478 [Nitzschia inconspicua]